MVIVVKFIPSLSLAFGFLVPVGGIVDEGLVVEGVVAEVAWGLVCGVLGWGFVLLVGGIIGDVWGGGDAIYYC